MLGDTESSFVEELGSKNQARPAYDSHSNDVLPRQGHMMSEFGCRTSERSDDSQDRIDEVTQGPYCGQ